MQPNSMASPTAATSRNVAAAARARLRGVVRTRHNGPRMNSLWVSIPTTLHRHRLAGR